MLGPKHPFYSANDHYRNIFGFKVIKLAIDGGLLVRTVTALFPAGAVYFAEEEVRETLRADVIPRLHSSIMK